MMEKRNYTLRRILGCAGIAVSLFWAGYAYAQQAPSGAFSAYAADSRKPIDIEADQLEVDDKRQVAVFRGNVSATQGDFNMRSKELTVTYAGGAKAKAPANSTSGSVPAAAAVAAPNQAAGPLGGAAEIKFIEANGKVLVTSKNNQSATSDKALFDVKAQTVLLTGDVVVTQNKNIIKGSSLLIDIPTGRSTFQMRDEAGTGAVKQRLKAVFSPQSGSGDKDQKQPVPGQPPKPATSSWNPAAN